MTSCGDYIRAIPVVAAYGQSRVRPIGPVVHRDKVVCTTHLHLKVNPVEGQDDGLESKLKHLTYLIFIFIIINWSAEIKTRRLCWYGHTMRLPEEPPSKTALKEAYRKLKKTSGGQTTTWISVLEKDLGTLWLTLEGATQLV